MCPRKGDKTCQVCGDAKYCSKDCQKLDWKNHKVLCASFKKSVQPGPNYRRALLFPGLNLPPRFEWVKLTKYHDGVRFNEDFLSTPFFGTEVKDSNSSDYNGIQGRHIARVPGEALHWFKKDIGPKDLLNTGLRHFTRGGACWQDWKGPVFVLRAHTDQQSFIKHGNMDMRDVRNAADFLSQTYRDGYDQEFLRDVRVLGTSVASVGDVQIGKPKWDEVVLNGCDKLWNSDGSMIANLLGIPDQARCELGNPYEKKSQPRNRNDEIKLLHLDVVSTTIVPPTDRPPAFSVMQFPNDLMSAASASKRRFGAGVTGFGSPIHKFDINTTGTAFVVRCDGKPLPKQHLEAICMYIKEKVEPQLIEAVRGRKVGEAIPERLNILNSITPANFLEYYDSLKARKVEEGDRAWDDIPSPYEITNKTMKDSMEQLWEAQKARGFEQWSEKMQRQSAGVFTQADMDEAHGRL